VKEGLDGWGGEHLKKREAEKTDQDRIVCNRSCRRGTEEGNGVPSRLLGGGRTSTWSRERIAINHALSEDFNVPKSCADNTWPCRRQHQAVNVWGGGLLKAVKKKSAQGLIEGKKKYSVRTERREKGKDGKRENGFRKT